MSAQPAIGDPAPDFTLKDGDGNDVSLSDQRGNRVILYFYPKDDTPGCTTEACGFRDLNSDIQALGATIYGVSADDVASHQDFANKYELNFPLLADEDREVVEAYGVWGERTVRDRTFMGIFRTTFAIGPDGRIEQVWNDVAPDGHSQEVLEWLQAQSA